MHIQDFSTHAAVAKLTSLARKPHDLAAPGGLTAERVGGYAASSVSFDLLYATQRVTPEVMDALQELADQAGLIDAFLAMKAGATLKDRKSVV